jgi:hypothetical protein
VQGSNILMRLPLLLRAGMFDENLNSMTDRDLCIRALDVLLPHALPEGQIAFTKVATAIHHAEADRTRVTTNTSAKQSGIRKFIWKHGTRFTQEDYDIFCERSQRLFDICVEELIHGNGNSNGNYGNGVDDADDAMLRTTSGDVFPLTLSSERYLQKHFGEVPTASATSAAAVSSNVLRGVIGIISSSSRRLTPLLRDIACLPSHLAPEILIFANTGDSEQVNSMRRALKTTALPFTLLTPDLPAVVAMASAYDGVLRGSASVMRAHSDRYGIGLARTVLQAHMRLQLDRADFTGDFALVLDDDKRLPASFLAEASVFAMDRSFIYGLPTFFPSFSTLSCRQCTHTHTQCIHTQ